MNDRENLKALADREAAARRRYNETDKALIRESKLIEGALRLASQPSADVVRMREAKHLVSSARAFLRYFNPCNLAEDKSQQHQALSHQCDITEAAIDALVPADGERSLYTHPAKAVDVEALDLLQLQQRGRAKALRILDAEAQKSDAVRLVMANAYEECGNELKALLTTGNASSETEGGR